MGVMGAKERRLWGFYQACLRGKNTRILHSLGGALSTMFAFRAAALGNELKLSSPITNVSFASPFVGEQGFRDEFYKLEQSQTIRHLRISNDEDVVPLIPYSSTFPIIPIPLISIPYKHSSVRWGAISHAQMSPFLSQEEFIAKWIAKYCVEQFGSWHFDRCHQ